MTKLLFSLLCFLTSIQWVFAINIAPLYYYTAQCGNLLQRQTVQMGINADKFKRVVGAEQAKELFDVVSEVNKIAGKSFVIPSRVDMQVFRYEYTAYHTKVKLKAGGELPQIVTPYQFGVEDYTKVRMSKHPKFSRPILAHEYGHAIFAENIYHEIPEWKELEETAYMMRYIEARLEQLRGFVKNPKLSPPPQVKDLSDAQAQLAHLEQVFKEASNDAQVQGAVWLNHLARSYNEVFADSVAVIYAKDPSAIAKALNFTKRKLDPGDFRDFMNKMDGAKWTHDEEHVLFSPVRYALGKNYIFNPQFHDHEEIVLRKIFNAITDEMRYYSRAIHYKDFSLLKNQTTKVINERFIKSVEQRFLNYDAAHVDFDRMLLGLSDQKKVILSGATIHPEIPLTAQEKMIKYGLNPIDASNWNKQFYQVRDIQILSSENPEAVLRSLGFELEKAEDGKTIYNLFPGKGNYAKEGQFGQKVILDEKEGTTTLYSYCEEFTQKIIMNNKDQFIRHNQIIKIY